MIASSIARRDALNGPDWKAYIERTVASEVARIRNAEQFVNVEPPIILPGMTVIHPIFGTGQILLANVIYREKGSDVTVLPFANELPDGLSMLPDGQTIESEDKGLIDVVSYQVAFRDRLIPMSREELGKTARLVI